MLLSIDPGVNNCGLSVIETHPQFKVVTTHNVKNTRKFNEQEKQLEARYNTRVVKVQAITEKVTQLLDTYPNITQVAIEAPFYNHLTPQAYGSLLEVISAIKYNILVPRNLPYRMLEPMLVKRLFADKGMAKKEVMKQFLITKVQSQAIIFDGDIELLTEHEIDAIAVGYVYHVSVMQERG